MKNNVNLKAGEQNLITLLPHDLHRTRKAELNAAFLDQEIKLVLVNFGEVLAHARLKIFNSTDLLFLINKIVCFRQFYECKTFCLSGSY